MQRLANVAVDRGAGVALFESAADSKALWTFSFGDALLLAENTWLPRQGSPIRSPEALGKLRIGMPSEHYFPAKAKKVVAMFLRTTYGVSVPKIALAAVLDRFDKICPPLALVPNIEQAALSSDASEDRDLQRLSWFFLPTIAVMRPPVDPIVFSAWFSRISPLA
jgi:hypothetical protein